MKLKIVLSIVLVGFCIYAVKAQTSQGSMLVGGNISLDIQNNKTETGSSTVDIGNTTTIVVNPTFGYFFIDGLAGGLQLNMFSSKFKSDDGNNETLSTAFTVGPFVKYYHGTGLFGMGSIGFGSQKVEFTSGGTTTEFKDGMFEWRLGAGYALFLNENVSVEPMLSYGTRTVTDKDADPEVKDITGSLRLSVGFVIFIN